MMMMMMTISKICEYLIKLKRTKNVLIFCATLYVLRTWSASVCFSVDQIAEESRKTCDFCAYEK